MTRDDGLLYSGASSAAFASPVEQEVKDKADLRKQDKLDKQNRLKPVADDILALINKHRDKVKSIEEFMVEEMITDEHFKSEVMARKKFMQFLGQFEREIKIVLKDVR